jgi:undecaprenyl-phosphate galactose phosphotransferase
MSGVTKLKFLTSALAGVDLAESCTEPASVTLLRPEARRLLERLPLATTHGSDLLAAAAIILADAAAFCLSVGGASLISDALPVAASGNGATLPSGIALPILLCLLGIVVGWFGSRGHYDLRVGAAAVLRDGAIVAVAGLLGTTGVLSLCGLPVPRGMAVCAAMILPPSLLALRYAVKALLDGVGLWRIPVAVVGVGPWAREAADLLRRRGAQGFRVVAELPASLDDSVSVAHAWLRRHEAQLVVIAADTADDTTTLADAMMRERVPFAILRRPDGTPTVRCWETKLDGEGLRLAGYRNNLRRPCARAVKIAFDLVTAGSALIVLAPVMLLIAALVSLDGGPVFYAHKRIGLRGRSFGCLKFRTMVTMGDSILQTVLRTDPLAAAEWAATHKLKNDPRVTWIGRLLRKTSLDELPQLLNVLRLEMSLVGPRPIVSIEVAKYAEDIAYYYETRPGITGLWQVSGRNSTSYARRVQLDSWYVKNWSLWQDIGIIARTFPAVITGHGAS